MTAKPRLMSATPSKESENGLIALVDEIVQDRAARRYAIIEYIVPQVIEITDGDAIPRVQLTLIEPFQPGAQHDQLISLLDAHYLARNQFSRGKTGAADEVELDLSGLDDGDAETDERAVRDAEFEAAAPAVQ